MRVVAYDGMAPWPVGIGSPLCCVIAGTTTLAAQPGVRQREAGKQASTRPILLYRLHHRWDNDNGPKPTDLVAVGNLISLTPKTIDRFVYVTSAGKLELVREGHKLCLMTYALLHTWLEGEGLDRAWLVCIIGAGCPGGCRSAAQGSGKLT